MRRARSIRASLAVAAGLFFAAGTGALTRPASADTPPAVPVSTVPVSEAAPVATGVPSVPVDVLPAERKNPAHYRGREEGTTPAQALAWIPRVLFFPVFAVTEFGIRKPVYVAAEWTDRNRVVQIVEKVFSPTPWFSWFPIVSLDFGANSSFGVKLKFKDALVASHDVRLTAETGGEDTWHFTLRDRFQLGPHAFAGARGHLGRIPNRAFYGLGPRSPNDRTNFQQTRGDALLFAGVESGNHLRLELSSGYRHELTETGWGPSFETRFSPRDLPGLGRIDLGITALDFRVDSRRFREENGGARLVGNVAYGRDFGEPERSFVTAELDVEGAVEVSYPDRVLALRAYAAETFALGREPVPFTHQAMLGWQNHHGFIWGRFRGDSALMAELSYRYPIAYFFDAQWTLSAGNVFGQQFRGFDAGALTGSIGVGLRTRRAGFGPLELLFALGTSRFEEPFSVDSVRVYFGTTEGL